MMVGDMWKLLLIKLLNFIINFFSMVCIAYFACLLGIMLNVKHEILIDFC